MGGISLLGMREGVFVVACNSCMIAPLFLFLALVFAFYFRALSQFLVGRRLNLHRITRLLRHEGIVARL
jgi:hypothetical protein